MSFHLKERSSNIFLTCLFCLPLMLTDTWAGFELMLKFFIHFFVRLIKWQDKKLTSLAMRLMKWTGRSNFPIHPKHLYDENRNLILRNMVKEGGVFLDIGSGAGTECLFASQNGATEVYGIELNPDLVRLSREKLRDSPVTSSILQTDLESAIIPLPDESVHLINFTNVLEHINNREGLLRELGRILHPRGFIYISIPNKNTPWKRLQRYAGVDSRDDEDHKIEYDEASLYAELSKAELALFGALNPVVPSLPLNGIFALTAPFCPKLYKRLQNWKVNFVRRKPQHTIGWSFLCVKLGER